ncbi:ABC transporter permease [Methylophilaceae bacterium]|nr:ABC transporter permease [Methylophilaceae bacterium]
MLKLLFTSVCQIFGIFLITFLILHLIPGDPVLVMMGESSSLADQEKLRSELGLDKSIIEQIINSISQLVQGNFGTSILTNMPIKPQLLDAMKNTYTLASLALGIAIFFGFIGGILAAKFHGSYIDRSITNVSLFFISIPHFFLGPLLILMMSIYLGLLPVSGMESKYAIILPALTLALGLLAVIIKMTRNSMLEIINSDVVRTARAKGLGEFAITLHHMFRLVLIPLITIIGMQFGSLLSGAVITETIFSWDGLGRLLITSIQTRDYPVTQACILIIASSYVFINFLTEVAYRFLDPRMRH